MSSPVHAQEAYSSHYLTMEDIKRLKVVKRLLCDIDHKSLEESIQELEKTKRPRLNLEIKEAMAHAYADIVRDYHVEGQKKKEWLYSMVCLNMAYLQFGGGQGRPGGSSSLNLLIRQELKKYLPENVLNQPGFLYSI